MEINEDRSRYPCSRCNYWLFSAVSLCKKKVCTWNHMESLSRVNPHAAGMDISQRPGTSKMISPKLFQTT